ncbi:phospholipase_D-nuclease N-terminal [Bellilinea caldifistulae]|uniref:Negative regulatory protein YxlE n=1 Tax=Bellilinea caldifistulae TaxID=360411 RepID=A0A0P6X791_9CHLR|nr:PLD nuclease N-terminal domain-containing protein [Bellilinea caldifistulae]KPL78911.1 Negative regulatory protein YxlE [Bellilinea caldifistulae]GAP09133.1 phospholipase_D-nuclease N-terminal [Bellilinea caldifistulae]
MNFEELTRFLPFLIPVVILQGVLMLVALIDLLRRERTRGPKWVWLLVILFVNLFGPIAYLMFGKEEE